MGFYRRYQSIRKKRIFSANGCDTLISQRFCDCRSRVEPLKRKVDPEEKEKFRRLTCRNAALSVSFNASIQNCMSPVVCCNFPVQLSCCSCRRKFFRQLVIIKRSSRSKSFALTLSVLNLASRSILIVSMRNSLRSWIIWMSDSHWALTRRSNSMHDSWMASKWEGNINLHSFQQAAFSLLNFSFFASAIWRQTFPPLSTANMNSKIFTEQLFDGGKKFSNYASGKSFCLCIRLLKCSRLCSDMNFKELFFAKLIKVCESKLALQSVLRSSAVKRGEKFVLLKPKKEEFNQFWKTVYSCLPSLCRSFLWDAE